jgi:hypothetical protein
LATLSSREGAAWLYGWLSGLARQVWYGASLHALDAAAAPALNSPAAHCLLPSLRNLWRCSQEEFEVLEQRIVMPDPSSATLVRKLVAPPEAAAAAAGAAAGRRGKAAAAPRECSVAAADGVGGGCTCAAQQCLNSNTSLE